MNFCEILKLRDLVRFLVGDLVRDLGMGFRDGLGGGWGRVLREVFRKGKVWEGVTVGVRGVRE